MDQSPPSEPVPIPANIDLEDKIVGDYTARQLIILGGGGFLVYAAYQATRDVLPLVVFALLAAPVAAIVVALALARRDGIALDRYVLAALRHLLATRRLTPTEDGRERGAEVGGLGRGGWWARVRRPVGPVRLPAREVAQAPEFGVVDLGAHGLAALAVVSTVSWTLRSGIEQDALVATFARWLHCLCAPVQLLVRAIPLDLSGHLTQLAHDAAGLGARALAEAAADHAAYLGWLADEHDLLRRQVIIVFREPNAPTPAPGPAAQARRDRAALHRLGRRLADAATLLGPAGLTVTALDAAQASTVLDAACRPVLTGHPEPGGAPGSAGQPDGAGLTGGAGEPPAGYTADQGQGWYPLPGGWPR